MTVDDDLAGTLEAFSLSALPGVAWIGSYLEAN